METKSTIVVFKETEKGFSLNDTPVGAILRIENEISETSFTFSVINSCRVSGGDYYLYIIGDNGKIYDFNLGKKCVLFKGQIEENLTFISNLSCGLIYRRENELKVVAYSSDKRSLSLATFKSVISSNLKESEYDDDAVATENYYDFEGEIREKIDKISKQEQQYNSKDENALRSGKEDGQKEETETVSKAFDRDSNRKEGYYERVKEELNSVLKSFPKEKGLEQFFDDSTFVRVPYGGNKYYVVGVIKEEDKAKYICYGVPSKYSETAPKELKGYCSFLPTSIFDMKGLGYWMMFQDAVTGKCAKFIEN